MMTSPASALRILRTFAARHLDEMRPRVASACGFPLRSLHSLEQSRGHVLQCLGLGHGSLLTFASTRAACTRPGPACRTVPRRLRSYAALRLPAPIGPRSGSPCRGLPRCGRSFCATRADDTCARLRAVRRRRVAGSPPRRDSSRRGEGRLDRIAARAALGGEFPSHTLSVCTAGS
jgi:hypothetical protein